MVLADIRRRLPSRMNWRRPEVLLLLLAAAVPLSFSTWQALLNNFAIESAAFTGAEIGILQSLREVPGFLAFAVVFLLLWLHEQTLAVISLALLGIGTALTGFFPTVLGLYCTTVLMSLGFHYYETVQTSLTLQWIDRDRAPRVLGRLIAIGSLTALVAYGLIFIMLDLLALEFRWVYLCGGGLTLAIALAAWLLWPRYPAAVEQHKHMVLRQRYWLYYALTFMSGARRQIFVVFAGFLMVEKFGYSAAQITLLFFINCLFNIAFAARIGRWIGHWGERRALGVEYVGLILVFVAYAFVSNPIAAATLYVLDHLFFALAIAIKTYFQKIADPADIASSAGVAFTINHIAAVVLPALLGLLWLVSPAAVFLCGAAMAGVSLLLSRLVPSAPAPGRETALTRAPAIALTPGLETPANHQ